jgi:hypothetical protein
MLAELEDYLSFCGFPWERSREIAVKSFDCIGAGLARCSGLSVSLFLVNTNDTRTTNLSVDFLRVVCQRPGNRALTIDALNINDLCQKVFIINSCSDHCSCLRVARSIPCQNRLTPIEVLPRKRAEILIEINQHEFSLRTLWQSKELNCLL